MKVNIERIHSRLEEIYQCGRKEDGTFTRMAYSPEDVKGRETFMNYFRKLGIEPRVDEAGNIHARLELRKRRDLRTGSGHPGDRPGSLWK